MWRRLAILTVTFAGTATALDLPNTPIPYDRLSKAFNSVSVTVSGFDACHRIDAMLADTRERQIRGLMWVNAMPDNAGMVFDYVRPREMSIWMKNTLIPLDIVFIGIDGLVINLYRDAEPLTLDSRRAVRPARYVLELNGGASDRLGLQEGSRVWID